MRERILAVDDDEPILRIVSAILGHDFDVTTAGNGRDALKLAADNGPFELFLLDVNMPGMNGYELCRSLKSDPHTHDVPVIFLTANQTPEKERQGFDMGAVDYVTKPISAPSLMARVQIHIELKKTRDQLSEQNRNLEQIVADRTRELAEKENELSVALQNMPSGIIKIDKSLKIQLFNSRYVELYELPEGLLRIGGSLKDMIWLRAKRGDYGPGDPEELIRDRLSGYGTDEIHVGENKLPSGRVLELIRNPMADGGLVAVATDITERKKAEDNLQKSEALMSAIVENVPGGVFVLDKDLNYVLTNNLYKKIFKIPDGMAAKGKPIEDVVRFLAQSSAYGNGDMDKSIEQRLSQIRNYMPTPIEVSFDDHTHLMTDGLMPDGAKIGIVTNITKLKEAEREIAKKEAQLRDILESSPYGVSILDRETHERVFSNPRFNEMFTGDRDVAMDRRDIADSYANSEDMVKHRQASEDGNWNLDTEVLRKRTDGSTWWSQMSVRPIDFENRPAHMFWLFDITERMKSEETARRLREAMEVFTDSIILYDADERVVFTNDQYHAFYPNSPPKDEINGYSQEQLIRRSLETGLIDNLQARDDPEGWLAGRMAERRDDKNITGESAHSDGRTHFYRHRPTTDGGLIVAHTDITDLKRAQDEITHAHLLITQSIDYAANIQRSALPADEDLKNALNNHFVIWEPCDRVGGDIYWHRKWGDGDVVILADCTGHGVPGAFMTLIAGGALDQALTEVKPGDCAALIESVHQHIQRLLGQDSNKGHADDGLELGACFLPKSKGALTYAGANIALYVQENGAISLVKADKTEIGYRRLPYEIELTNHEIETKAGMCFYMTTDGLPSQVGEAKRLPFGNKRFLQLLESLVDVPMKGKGQQIMEALNQHLGNAKQRDDISLIGFEIGSDTP
jgi:PAS domain S-box-containing protein